MVRVLVTGGAGFIGSYVSEELLAEGHSVVVIDNLSTGQRHYIPSGAEFIEGDIRCPQQWSDQVGTIDGAIHLAAQASVPVGEKNPVYDLDVNLAATLKVIDAAHGLGAQEFRFASSAAVYGESAALPLKESTSVDPISFYGLSKASAESYIAHYANTRQMTAVVLRLANVYGPRQRFDGEGGVVAIFCHQLAHGQWPVIYGDGQQTRDFIMVRDVARAFGHRLGHGAGGTFNIGTGQATRLQRMWEVLAGLGQWPVDNVHYEAMRSGDIRDSVMDITQAQRWGFGPRVGLGEGLAQTLQYFVDGAQESKRQEI